MNIKEAAMRAGISVRTLRYYEETGLITPDRGEGNAYREYNEAMVQRARMIHAYRELQFPVKAIAALLDAPSQVRDRMMEEHIEQLRAKQKALQNRIDLAQGLRMMGIERMAEIDFENLDAQMQAARQHMEENPQMRELTARFQAQSEEQAQAAAEGLLRCLAEVANTEEAQVPAAMARLREYIEANYYPCTDQLLRVYARAYGGNGMLAQTLENIAGEGAAQRLCERIETIVGQAPQQ